MDHTFSLGDAVLGGMLLELAGHSRLEENMVLTVTTGSTDVAPIEAALPAQHCDIDNRGCETNANSQS